MKKFKRIIKIIEHAILFFRDKDLMNYAASLSFNTVLSIIPLLLVSLSIFTNLPSFSGYYQKMKDFIFSSLLPSHQEIITEQIDGFLQNSVSLGIVGFIAIIITTILFFSNYEYIINKIMGTKSKGFWQNLSAYWTLITLAPLGLGTSFYITASLQSILNKFDITRGLNFVWTLPYIIVWIIFIAVYMISINKAVDKKNLLISSFLTSVVWNLCKLVFIEYAFYNKSYSNIYGSFSIVLFFFIWIYISWIVFLLGLKSYRYLEVMGCKEDSNEAEYCEDF